ncbi:MAG: hypothetical protein ACJ8C4_10440 [Gemmataceae bacterium]
MFRSLRCGFALLLISAVGFAQVDVRPSIKKGSWTSDEIFAQLQRQPNDPYLQYVYVQLSKREGKPGDAARMTSWRGWDPGRRQRADLFSTFTGALAVQESLQLDTLLGEPDSSDRIVPAEPAPGAPAENTIPEKPADAPKEETPAPEPKEKAPRPHGRLRNAIHNLKPKAVSIDTLTGPTIKSHPWEKMLAGRKPDIGPLANCVPQDFYFLEFKSIAKLVAALKVGDVWGDHLFTQMLGQASSQDTEARIKKQLGIAGIPPELIDVMGVEGVAITGSDLYLSDGSDITILVLGSQVVRMRQWADSSLNRGGNLKREDGQFMDVKYVHSSTPNGELNVYTADPHPNLHIRSNSLPSFKRVLEAIAGKSEKGTPVQRLGESTEFAFIRTILPRGDGDEDGIIYLSDPCIRRLVGPRVKLGQRRRLMAFNHLKMIEHAALMFRTENGRAPKSFEEMALSSDCAPGIFGRGKLACPSGGTYTLTADGMSATSSVYGAPGRLTPLLEVPIDTVTVAESEAYRRFLDDYNQYWRTYFDPIAVRVKVTPQQYRLETVVLPLIDNSIYTTMATALAGPPTALDPLPASKRAIMTLAMRLNKQPLLDYALPVVGNPPQREQDPFGIKDAVDTGKLRRFLTMGIGDQIAIHVLDAAQPIGTEVSSAFGGGAMMQEFGPGINMREMGMVSLLASSLTHPACLTIPVKDAKVVDEFLNEFDKVISEKLLRDMTRFFQPEFYKISGRPQPVRCIAFKVFGFTLRLCWGRIGDSLCIVNHPSVLDDISSAATTKEAAGPPAHAMLRIRPENWNAVLPVYRLGWAEGQRNACQSNQMRIANVARGWPELVKNGEVTPELLQKVSQLYGVRPYCPDLGQYKLNGQECSCPIHGGWRDPKQPAAPAADSATAKTVNAFDGLTATLTFRENGLHAVVNIQRKAVVE